MIKLGRRKKWKPILPTVIQLRCCVRKWHVCASVCNIWRKLANSRRALIKAFYSRQPLPFSEEELKKMVEEERGVPLEEFIADLENTAQG